MAQRRSALREKLEYPIGWGRAQRSAMKTILSGCIATLVLSFASTSLAGPPCAGSYPSWGRACYGSVEITARSIAWRAQFSNCKASPYEVIASDLQGEKPFVAYRFK